MVAPSVASMQPPVAPNASHRGTLAGGSKSLSKLNRNAVWITWRSRAEDVKKAAKKTDEDLAAEVSELVGYEVSRQLVNAWFRGRRVPSLPEFMSLCAALGADPGEVLFDVKITHQYVKASDAAPALRATAPTPDYLIQQAQRLRRFKAKRKKIRIKVL